MHCLRIGVVLLVTLTGCAQEEFSSTERITSRADAVIAQPIVGVFSERSFEPQQGADLAAMSARVASKQIGEDCSGTARKACASGLCLKMGGGPGDGWKCSASCKQFSDCPQPWQCRKIFPDANGFACVPPPAAMEARQ